MCCRETGRAIDDKSDMEQAALFFEKFCDDFMEGILKAITVATGGYVREDVLGE